nr:hypothetical protein B11C_200072 [Bartonella sp. 1-1C]
MAKEIGCEGDAVLHDRFSKILNV